MHPRLREALERIDAAVFSGDTFDDPDARKEFAEYVERWCHALDLPDEFGKAVDEDERNE